MTTSNCVSNWRTRLEKSISTEENRAESLKLEIAELRQKQRHYLGKEYDGENTAARYGLDANNKEALLNCCLNTLEKLKKQHRLHVSSSTIGAIETINSAVAQKANSFEQNILEVTREREQIIQKIGPVKQKVDIAKQFGGTTEAVRELELLEAELAQTNTQLDGLRDEYRVFSVAKDHQNDACLVSKDTPGFQLRQLYEKLAQESDAFAVDVETKRKEMEQKIATSLESYLSAIKELGELKAAVGVRNMELQSVKKPDVRLASPITMPKPSEDLNRLQHIFDGAAAI